MKTNMKTFKESFDIRIKELETFIKNTGRLPKHRSEDKSERSLAIFITNNRNNSKIVSIVSRKRERLNYTFDLDQALLFCEKVGRLPNTGSKDPEEKRAYYTYKKSQGTDRDKFLKFRKKKVRGEKEPRFQNKRETISKEKREEECTNFVQNFGRKPRKRSCDAIERSLAKWYYSRGCSKEFKKVTEAIIYSANAQRLIDFCEHNQRLPRQVSGEYALLNFLHKNKEEFKSLIEKFSTPPITEEELISFLENEKRYPQAHSNNLMERRLYILMTRNKEGKYINYFGEKIFIKNLIDFCNKNNRLPQQGSKDFLERRLYRYYIKNKDTAEVRDLINRFLPEMSMQAVRDFCERENRLPLAHSKDLFERRLYLFLIRLVKLNNEEAKELYSFYKGSHHSLLDPNISIEIQDFYNQFGRFPKDSSLIEEEKVLGEKLVKDPDKALNGVKITLAPIVYRDFEQFTMAQQCEILSILGLPSSFIDEACEGRKKKATTKTLKEVFENHGAELVESKDQKKQTSKSITEIGKIKRFSVVMAEYKADPHSPYLINESLNGLWDTIITESKYSSTSTYNELVSDTEQTEFFNIIKNQLVEEYKKATEYIPSREYSGKYDPDLMQRLCIIRLREKKYYANWSKTGTGKTLQSLLSSLDIDSKITLYILPNSTVSDKAGTKKKDGAIKEFIPNSNVIIYNGSTSLKSIIPDKRNYILVNYDKLSRARFLRPLEDLAKEGKIDFICIDEVQMAKSRGDKAASNRNKALLALRRLAEDYNPNLYVLGLTATPVINNLYEVKTLCEIITGKNLGDDRLFSGNTISFAAAQTAHKYIVNYGFRYNYDYSKEIAEKETIIPIRGGKDLYNRINEINNKFKDLGKSRRGMAGIKELEDSQIIFKLEACKHLIKPGVVIYTQYVGGEKENNTITIINRWLRQNGLESVLYTGQMNDLTEDEETGEQIKIRDEELQRFIGDSEKGIIGTNKTKVLIASSVLRTGVDGLQKVSNTIIMLSLPWTYADYEQLKGRFIRRNSNFNEVNIYIPTVSLKLTTGEWSWDKSKWEILQYKKDLSDLIIYGNYCDSNILRIAQTETERSLIEKALSQIDAPLEIYSEEIHPDIDYCEVKRRLGNPRPYRRPKGSCIIHIHKRYDTMDTVEIEGDMAAPERRGSMTDYWIDQDSIVRKSGYVDPNTETSYLIQDIYGGLDKKVADLGCGPHDPLRKLVTNCEEFFSCTFESEEITLPLDVVRCDSTRLNMVEDKYFDVVNHTNSHWGTNLDDYVLEDYRILKDDGVLIITSVCPPRRNKYKIIANAYLESGLWEYLVEPVRFGGKSGMTRGIFKKKGI